MQRLFPRLIVTTPDRLPEKLGGMLISMVIGLVLIIVGAAGYDAYALSRLPIDYPPPGDFVAVNGARLHYICQGQGEPTLMLIAGFGGGALDWSPVMPALAEHRRVCAFDRLGQDWSDAAPAPRTLASSADDLALAAQQLGISHPVVVGHSLGGSITLAWTSLGGMTASSTTRLHMVSP